MTPEINTASKNASNEGKELTADNTITVNPAAGPLTLNGEPLNKPMTIPPTAPAIIPEKAGTPDATATPRHKGRATRKTTSAAGKS